MLTMVVLTSFLISKGSAESKDSDDELKETLARLERRLEEMAAASPSGNGRGAPAESGLSRTEGGRRPRRS